MRIDQEAEEYVKEWLKNAKGYGDAEIEHGKGYDIRVPSKGLLVEVKASTKLKFRDFRPYLTLNELKNAASMGEKFEIHILLGMENGKPSKHYKIKGTEFFKYKKFIEEAENFLEKWNKELDKEGMLRAELSVYLKREPKNEDPIL